MILRRSVKQSVDLWVLHRQLGTHVAGSAASAIGNSLNVLLAVALYFTAAPTLMLVLAPTALILVIGWRYWIASQVKACDETSPQLRQLHDHVVANAFVLGGLWGGFAGYLVTVGGIEHQIFAIALGSGMMGAGTMSYRTVYRASVAYLLAAAPGCLVGLAVIGTGPALASIGLLLCYIGVLLSNNRISARSFAESHEHGRALESSSETIQLLLNDFAEQGSDWLIELGLGGRILNPCARLAEAAQRPIETLMGKRLPMLLDAGRATDELDDHLAEGRPFRQHLVSLTINGERFWWSISARPTRSGEVRFRGVVTDVTAQRRAEERISHMAHYDGLTDLPNRFSFTDAIGRALKRSKGNVGLIYFDVDQFKAVNDTLGHPIGDKLLKAIADRLEADLSPGEVLARLGGDEFALMAPAASVGRVNEIVERLQQAFVTPFSLGEHQILISASMGMACAPDHADDFEGLFRRADLALRTSKANGRNCATWFEPGMDDVAEERRLLEADLRRALVNGEFRLHYQPIVAAAAGNTLAYEALVRWAHPTRGTVMPSTFIPLAEDSGLIVQLGEWVIREALQDMATWPEDVGVSINLSPAQMRSPNLVSTVVNAIARTGVDPKRIILEITETVLLHDSESNLDTLHRLRALGVGIALDDFGTGYSSLNYLRCFPFDKIKIDRSFVRDIESREDCRAIVRSVVQLAKSLGMTTIAEGVEREAQVKHLIAEGCDTLQGFLYSPAVPAHELSDLRTNVPTLDQKLVLLEETRRRVEQTAAEGNQPRAKRTSRLAKSPRLR